MFKRIIIISILLAVCALFYLTWHYQSVLLLFASFVALGLAWWYANHLLTGGEAGMLARYFKRRGEARMSVVESLLAGQQALPADLTSEEAAAILSLSIARHNLPAAHQRLEALAQGNQPARPDGELFDRLAQLVETGRTLGLSREYRLRLIAFGAAAAERYHCPEWAEKFCQQRELIFQRHAASIPVIRRPR